MIIGFFFIAVLVVCGAVVYQLFLALPRGILVPTSIALVGCVLGLPSYLLLSLMRESPQPLSPLHVPYQTSVSCQKCHADHYESWYNTYHRTMTQEVSPETVMGNFNGEPVHFKGLKSYPIQSGDGYFQDLIDIDWEAEMLARGEDPSQYPDPPRVRWPVDRLVGSHNMQVYLTSFPNGKYMVLPLVWHQGEERWISREGSFLGPESDSLYMTPGEGQTWNFGCVFCHNTQANPGMVLARNGHSVIGWNTRFEEIGIACEACHGPGARHVAANHNPMRRSYLQQTGSDDPTIVNPAKLPKAASVQACGRCHGKWLPKDTFELARLTEGEFFKPGDWGLDRFYKIPGPEPGRGYSREKDSGYFWPDWTPRPNALEYQGVLLSPCYQRGEMTCLSCHSMHRAEASDQLISPEGPGATPSESNRSCIQCHSQFDGDTQIAAHTRHAASSSGSQCYNCHMPHQSYALLKAIRSHRISSPDVARTAQTKLPNGCNQCHVDKSLQWSAEWLHEWFNKEMPLLSGDDVAVSSTLVDLLKGDALNRALAASQLGWSPALEAAPGIWRAPFLIYALGDSYAAVRLLAYQSLRRVPGFEAIEYDYLADDETRQRQIAEARNRWSEVASGAIDGLDHSIPLTLQGWPNPRVIERLLTQQDRRGVHIVE